MVPAPFYCPKDYSSSCEGSSSEESSDDDSSSSSCVPCSSLEEGSETDGASSPPEADSAGVAGATEMCIRDSRLCGAARDADAGLGGR